MSPKEFWLEYDMHVTEYKKTVKGAGGFTEAEWDAARKAHKEKMSEHNSET